MTNRDRENKRQDEGSEEKERDEGIDGGKRVAGGGRAMGWKYCC